MSKNKEINIFNLSFLDLLTGALGGVIIVFLCLSVIPHHDEDYPRIDREKAEKQLEYMDSIRENVSSIDGVVKGKNALTGSEVAGLRELAEGGAKEVKALENIMVQFQNVIHSLIARIERLKDALIKLKNKKSTTEKEIDKLEKMIDENRMITVMLQWYGKQDFDLTIYAENASQGKRVFRADLFAMDLTDRRFGEFTETSDKGPGMELFFVQNPPPGNYQIWVTLPNVRGDTNPPEFELILFNSGVFHECKMNYADTRKSILKVDGTPVSGIHVMDVKVDDHGYPKVKKYSCGN